MTTTEDQTDDAFAIEFTPAGPLAALNYTVDDLMTLEAKYGDDYLSRIFSGLNLTSLKMIRDLLKVGVKSGDTDKALQSTDLTTIKNAIAEALTYRLTGKRMDEAEEAEAS